MLFKYMYLGETDVRELLKRELVFLTALAVHLTYVDTAGRDGGQAHTVPDEDDHILGTVLVVPVRQDPLQGLLAGLQPEGHI